MSDWDKYADKVKSQIDQARKNQQEFNNKQELLKAQAPIIWAAICDAANACANTINTKSPGALTVTPDNSYSEAPGLMFMYNLPPIPRTQD